MRIMPSQCRDSSRTDHDTIGPGLREPPAAVVVRRPVLVALGVAVVTGCVTSLVQAYGVETDLFSVNRSPGGTLGNRNFVGHAAAFGLPLVLVVALRASRAAGFLLGALGAGMLRRRSAISRRKSPSAPFDENHITVSTIGKTPPAAPAVPAPATPPAKTSEAAPTLKAEAPAADAGQELLKKGY